MLFCDERRIDPMGSGYKSWPFREAEKPAARLKQAGIAPGTPVRFETGFGPSGLPHVGTFAEVARTTWVMNAFRERTGAEAELIAFSDDLDGLRKVPLNLPGKEMLQSNLGKPLSSIPDPFGCCDSYSGHMNGKLREFLDRHGFEYRFQSAKEAYRNGDFNEGLAILMQKLDEVRNVILPTLGEDKREGWFPFFPICESCGGVNTTSVTECFPSRNAVAYKCDREFGCGADGDVSIFDGKVKTGWKVDWALRWFSYDIAYEMYGKDLIESARLSGKIIRIMGKPPPAALVYEMFLDEDGRKISKSVGKGLTVDTWMDYAPIESLLYYIFQNPRKARRLFWDMVPRVVDDYIDTLRGWPDVKEEEKPDSVLWHIFNRGAAVPEYGSSINYSIVHNLLSALGMESGDLVREYLEAYDPEAKAYPEIIDDIVEKSLLFYRDFVLPKKQYRKPTPREKEILRAILARADAMEDWSDEQALQSVPFDVAREFGEKPPDVFRVFYQVILGQERGPRFGGFAKLAGRESCRTLFEKRLGADPASD